MHSSRPRVFAIAPNWGLPNSTVFAVVTGIELQTITLLRFSGSGVAATILAPPRADRIEMVLSIAPDTAAGPRALLLSSQADAGRAEAAGVIFYVRALSGYASGRGIGSHLI